MTSQRKGKTVRDLRKCFDNTWDE